MPTACRSSAPRACSRASAGRCCWPRFWGLPHPRPGRAGRRRNPDRRDRACFPSPRACRGAWSRRVRRQPEQTTQIEAGQLLERKGEHGREAERASERGLFACTALGALSLALAAPAAAQADEAAGMRARKPRTTTSRRLTRSPTRKSSSRGSAFADQRRGFAGDRPRSGRHPGGARAVDRRSPPAGSAGCHARRQPERRLGPERRRQRDAQRRHQPARARQHRHAAAL